MQMTSENPKPFEQLKLNLKALDGLETKVGWFEDAKYENGTPVAYIAAIQELGSPAQGIPPRPFMRTTVIDKKNEWMEKVKILAGRVLTNKMTAAQAMDTLGEVAEADIRKTIAAIHSPALKKSTLAARRRRGNNSIKPLNDTGYMIDTLAHKVDKS